jgi:hypothetical protein
VGPRAGLNAVTKIKTSRLYRESNPSHAARSLVTILTELRPAPLLYVSGIALGYGLDDRRFESVQGLGIFLFATAFRPALCSTQPPVECVSGALSLGSGRGVKLTPHIHLVLRSRMSGTIPPLLNTPSWRGAQFKFKEIKAIFGELCCRK